MIKIISCCPFQVAFVPKRHWNHRRHAKRSQEVAVQSLLADLTQSPQRPRLIHSTANLHINRQSDHRGAATSWTAARPQRHRVHRRSFHVSQRGAERNATALLALRHASLRLVIARVRLHRWTRHRALVLERRRQLELLALLHTGRQSERHGDDWHARSTRHRCRMSNGVRRRRVSVSNWPEQHREHRSSHDDDWR